MDVNRPGAGATREDVLREVERRFPPEQREEVLAALDRYVGRTPAERARVQLTILDRSRGDPKLVHELASHLLVESSDVEPPPDRDTLRNDGYAG